MHDWHSGAYVQAWIGAYADEERKASLRRIASHEPATLPNQFRWLLEAGFDEVECFARDRCDAPIGAFRPG